MLPLLQAFLARFRDALLIVDRASIQKLKNELLEKGYSIDEVEKHYKTNYSAFLKRCRRVVPPPEVLLRRLNHLEAVYGGLKDANTGEQLFSPVTWAKWKLFKEHCRLGCLSDHPDIPLYLEIIKEDGRVRRKLACCRGTNALEGYHLHLREVIWKMSIT